jgi:hypothetical protein
MKLIEIFVLPNGQTKVQTKGFAGGDCREASKFLESALGHVTSDKLTAEFFHAQRTEQTLRQGQ